MINLLKPPLFDDEDTNLTANQLFIIVWTFMAVGLLALFIAIFVPETVYRWLLLICYLELIGALLLILNKYGHVRLVGSLLIFTLWLATTSLAVTGGGISSDAITIYFIIVLIAGLVQNVRAGIVTAIFCSLTGLFLVYLQYSGKLPSNQVPHTPLTLWIASAIYMIVIVSLQYLIGRTINKTLYRSRKELKKRQLADAALRESERRYRLITENTADLISTLDMNLRFTYISPATWRLRGYSAKEAMQQPLAQALTPESMRLCLSVFEEEMQLEASGTADPDRSRFLELQEYARDGSIIWAEVSLSFLRDNEGKAIEILVVTRDVTGRKRTEKSLRESEEKYRLLFDHSPLGHLYFNDSGIIVTCNDNFIRLVGSSREALIDLNMLNLPDHNIVAAIKRVLSGGFATHEGIYHSITSSKITPVRALFAPVIVEGNKVLGGVGIVEDITERKRAEEEKHTLEERLQRAEKMESLGQLAGGVAHDLNNILGILSGYSELLLLEIPEGQRAKGYAEKILQSTQKGASIIQDLLTLARRGVSVSAVINLNDVVSDFLKSPVFEKMKDYHPSVNFIAQLDKNLLNIKGSSVHLEKTLMNLLSNAAESVSGKGEVTIRTESRHLDMAISGYDKVKEGDYVVLTVSDTGMGIPAENRDKIFEPFYTKKIMGRSGTGLGLAIVWGTVKDHNGYIDLQTKVGEGTAFILYFPATREETTRPSQQVPMELCIGNRESVLVVDDIAEQRDVAAGLLTALGYEVHTVGSGEEALEYLRRNKADIMILDMIMEPGIDGLETYEKVLAINPQQKAILVSGFSETNRVREAQRLGAGAYVKKPYLLEKIGVAIRDELKS